MPASPANAEIFVFTNKSLGTIEGPLFGQFIELAGRCINNGLYDPESPFARADGIRTDVLEALKELRPTHIRYPGGCANAYFDWQELVGPVNERPRAKLFRETGQTQSTAFGIPEVWALCQELGCELYLTVNAHTQTPEDAANLVEYLNGTTHTKWADLRRAHGREEPYGIKYFGLGNEIYGDWQPGVKTAEEYAANCREAIRQMKNVDPSITITVCGLGRPLPEWDRTVLKGVIDRIDLLSVHNYFGRPIFQDCMVASHIAEQMFNQLNVNIDEVLDANLEIKKRPRIAFDEWNTWYRSSHGLVGDLEETFHYADALTVASIFHVILRNTQTIGLSNISLLINTMGVLFSDPQRMVRQTIFFPQVLMRNGHAGRVVETAVDGPTFSGKHERFFCGIVDTEKAKDETRPSLLHFKESQGLDVLVSIDDAKKKMSMSVINKLQDQPVQAKFNFRGLQPQGSTMTVHRLTGGEENVFVENTLDHPDRVGLMTEDLPFCDTFTFPAASLTLIEFSC